MAAQRIDQAVECFVGNRFLLVAPAGQNDDLGILLEIGQEAVDECALARARPTDDELESRENDPVG